MYQHQNPERENSFNERNVKKELGAILECKAEESSLKLVKDTKKSTEFEKDFIKASSNVGFQNVEDYLNEDIKLPENLKPLNFLKIKIGSKISNSENQYGHTANITDSQIRSENIGNLEEKQKLLQISQHSSVFGKILTESSNANIGSNAEVKKREKVFEFQDVTSEISEVSFQIRKRNESHISHFSPLLLNKPLKNEKEEVEFNFDIKNIEDANININEFSGSKSPAQIKWKKISNVFHSLSLFQKNEVNILDNVEHLEKEVLSFEVAAKLARGTNTDERKEPSKMFYSPKEPKNDKINILKDTFEAINRDQDFSDCCERGRTEDIERIREILQKDPKKYIIERTDPGHLINKLFISGLNPCYLAAKNGNLNILKFLIENKASPYINSKIGNKIYESPLEVASRWGHINIVKYLMENFKYKKEIIISSYKITSKQEIRNLLRKYLRKQTNNCFYGCFNLKNMF